MENLHFDEVISEEDIKSFMRLVMNQAKMHPIIYKYLTYQSGCLMLQNHNLQFTRGDKLNDVADLNISKFDTDGPNAFLKSIGCDPELIETTMRERANELSSFGVCSFGISPHNSILWDRYSSSQTDSQDGICIGINQIKTINALLAKGLKTACIMVRYKDDVSNSIPWLALNGNSPIKTFAGYQLFALKNSNPWEHEQEIRLVYTNIMDNEYVRFELPKDCFESVYYGKDMPPRDKQKLGQILSQQLPKVKRIPLSERSKFF